MFKCRLKRLNLHQMQMSGFFYTDYCIQLKTNLGLDNAFINDTNIFCPRCLRREMFRVRFYIF